MRLKFSIAIARLAGFASKKILHKSGATIPGKILLKIFPTALEVLAKERTIILVSGTNGKTSTTRAIVKSVSSLGVVVSNSTGSNLDRGVATALMAKAKIAVLEVDELHLIKVAQQVKPRVVLLLNLTRDQLHRMHEVKKVAQRWHELAKELPDTVFVGDVDDPFVAYALSGATSPIRVTFGGRPHEDGAVCPACGRYLNWSRSGFKCGCGLTNKDAAIVLTGDSAALRNAQLANIAGKEIGANPIPIEESELERSATLNIFGISAKVRLTKNPASWRESLRSVTSDKVILILNAREVDGIDTSWLWDIDFTSLKGKKVAVTGERALDLIYRLHVQGIVAKDFKDFDNAIKSFEKESKVDVLAAYTAFHGLVMS
jgi:lipid II isoglutaminyl synthase (glutamine-hydrolysing)